MSTFRVFLASPSDVGAERQHAIEVIQEFNNRIADNLGVRITPLHWEQASPDLGDPQDLINGMAETADLVVVVFWRRLGTPTSTVASGTLEEFENARKRWNAAGRPDVWVYFREIDDTLSGDPGPQLSKLLDFRRRFEEDRLGLSCSYRDPMSFRCAFQTHLYQRVIENIMPSDYDRDSLGGVIPVVSRATRRDLEILSRLRRYLALRCPERTFDMPVVINPPKATVDAYADGLAIVHREFWTTAFLESVYLDGHPRLHEANEQMLTRIRRNGGSARRLFVCGRLPADEARWVAAHLRSLKEHGRTEEATDRERQFVMLKNSMTQLTNAGVETRVGCDMVGAYKRLRLPIDGASFVPHRFGLSIYDDVRLDVFQESTAGMLGSVSCFTPATHDFKGLMDAAKHYFEEIWDTALPLQEFLAILEDEMRLKGSTPKSPRRATSKPKRSSPGPQAA